MLKKKSNIILFLFQPSYPDEPRCQAVEPHHWHVEERLLGQPAAVQRKPRFVQTALRALLPPQLLGLRAAPLGLPPWKRAPPRPRHLIGLPHRTGTRGILYRHRLLPLRRPSGTLGGGSWCRRASWCSLNHILPVVIPNLHAPCFGQRDETGDYERNQTGDVGAVGVPLGFLRTSCLRDALQGDRDHGPGCVCHLRPHHPQALSEP